MDSFRNATVDIAEASANPISSALRCTLVMRKNIKTIEDMTLRYTNLLAVQFSGSVSGWVYGISRCIDQAATCSHSMADGFGAVSL